MTATWLQIGEPAGNSRVGARWITESDRGRDTVVLGTVPMDLLELIDGHEHEHDDGSLAVHHLDEDDRARVDDAFDAGLDRETFVELASGRDGPLTERQSEILWERRVLDHGRLRVSDEFGIAKSTVDSHLEDADARLDAAAKVSEQLSWIDASY